VALLTCFIKESRPSPAPTTPVESVDRQAPGVSEASSIRSMEIGFTISSFGEFAYETFCFPARLFFTEPIILAVTIMAASVFALLYLFTEAWPVVYKDFGFSELQIVLVPLALDPGLAFPFLVRVWDIKDANKMKRRGVVMVSQGSHLSLSNFTLRYSQTPENKLRGFFIAAPVYAIGLWWFAWTVPPAVQNVSPWLSITALVPIAFATNEFDHVLSSYLTDAYGPIAGSANAPLAFLRAVLSAVFPLFGVEMFQSFGSNYAGSLLAGLATLYCVVAVAFWWKGQEFREKSPWIMKNALWKKQVEKEEERTLEQVDSIESILEV
jgi:hypothetical protein